MRNDKRKNSELRPVKITTDYIKHAEGSCLIEMGETKVICTASVEEKVPPFLRGSGKGWVTAEYGMLPRSTNTRNMRETGKSGVKGRTSEIQRLIGRSLRAICDLSLLGERQIILDCDVIQADGGTRCASINGAMVALALAVNKLKEDRIIKENPIQDFVGAISVGISQSDELLDLNYQEDSMACVDFNVVMTNKGKFVEVQGTAEGAPFNKTALDKLLKMAEKGIHEVFEHHKKALKEELQELKIKI
ncbi:MAG: ribonuclease PH [Armatimonadota bacterium]